MNEAQARIFIRQFAAGQPVSAAAHHAFREWLLNHSDDTIAQLLEEYQTLIQQGVTGAVNEEWQQNLFKRIAAEEQQITTPVIPMPARRRAWWQYAAVLIVLLSGMAYLLLKQPATPPAVAVYHNDVAPGGNKATLTLADGSKVLLDDMQNGKVAQQGHVNIIKQANGQLLYAIAAHTLPKGTGNMLPEYNTLTTPRGGQYEVLLPDGSKVWLNAASSLRFPTAFTGKERKVTLTGEAYFEVAPAKATMPFMVEGNGYTIQVLGTRFNINAYENEGEQKASLLEGAIKVTASGGSKVMQPGQEATIASGHITIAETDTEEAIAWKNGLFQFNNAHLKQVLRQIERWYNVNIDYTNVPDKHFYGIVSRNSNLSQVLNMLEVTGAVQFEIQGNNLKIK